MFLLDASGSPKLPFKQKVLRCSERLQRPGTVPGFSGRNGIFRDNPGRGQDRITC